MAARTVAGLPPGFELEQQPTSATLPPGFEIEQQEPPHPDKNAPAIGGSHAYHGEAPLGPGASALGGLETLGTSLLNVPANAINALNDIANRISPHTAGTSPAPVPTVQNGAAGQAWLRQLANVPGISDAIALLHRGNTAVDAATSGSPTLQDVLHQAAGVTGDVMNILPVVPALKGASALEDAANSARTATAVPIQAANVDAALAHVGYRNLPRQNSTSGPVARAAAGAVGEPAVAGQQSLTNQAVTDRLAQHESGVPPDQELNYDNLKTARTNGPGQVYNAAHDALPPQLTQDAQLQADIQHIGDTTSQLPRSPDVDGLKSTMLNQPNMTSDELFANIQQARDRSSRLYASDKPDDQAMGEAYQQLANSYEDFVGRQLQGTPGTSVSLADWQNARTQFAKNYAVQSALKGTSADATKIAAMQRQNPEQLTGGLRLIAEQANRYPLSTRFGPTTFAPSGIGSSGSMEGGVARNLTGPAIGGAIGASLGGPGGAAVGAGAGYLGSAAFQSILRRALGGSPEAGAAQAGRAITGGRLSNFSGAPDPGGFPAPLSLQPPPGRAFEPNQPELAAGTPMPRPPRTPGELSTMAEQPALTGDLFSQLAPVLDDPRLRAPSTPEQLARRASAGNQPQPLSLAEEPSLSDMLEDLRDHPDVMSQGVPEGIMTRTSPRPSVNNASGQTPISEEFANAQEADRNAGVTRAIINPDGFAMPVTGAAGRDLGISGSSAGAQVPKNHIAIEEAPGREPRIISRGGLSQSQAQGLLARYLSLKQNPLGFEF